MNPAQLAALEEAGTVVLTLTEGVEQAEFLRSRLTRSETRAQVLRMADTLDTAQSGLRSTLQEIDWAGWETIGGRIRGAEARDADHALWFAVQALVPSTLMWLRFYREREPQVFSRPN